MKAMPPLTTKALNLVLYQAGWFCCVLGAAWGHPFLGSLGALLLIGIHLLLTLSRKAEIKQMLLFCLIGVALDSAQQSFGVFEFKPIPGWPLALPPWVFVIWAQFSTIFRYALQWLAGRYGLACVGGMVGGPLAYGGGVRLGAASFNGEPYLSLAVLAIVWGGLTPALFWLSGRGGAGEGGYRAIGGK